MTDLNAILSRGATLEEVRKLLHDGVTLQEIRSATDSLEAHELKAFNRPSDFTDAGNAVALSDYYGERMRYCESLGWLTWTGTVWEQSDSAALRLAMNFTEEMLSNAFESFRETQTMDTTTGKIIADPDAQRYLAHARASRSRRGIESMLKLSTAHLTVKASLLDADPFLLNTPAGIMDLRSGEMRSHDSRELCTKITAVAPGTSGAEMWKDFLQLVTDGDSDLEQYLQVDIGSSLIGTVYSEKINISVGAGRNGKSSFYNSILKVLGDYGGILDSTVLTTERQNRGAHLATLMGKRFIVAGELEEGQRLSTQTLKRLCSTDDISVERKYHDPEKIRPCHHITLFSNYLPRVGSTDAGTWRRIRVLPFNSTMPTGAATIPNYAERLANEAGPAILQWAIDGARMFIENGFRLDTPEVVKQATERYRQQEDWLQTFLSECCTVDVHVEARCGELYSSYKEFSLTNGDYIRRLSDFNAAMAAAGFQQISRRGNRKYWRGVCPIGSIPSYRPTQATGA